MPNRTKFDHELVLSVYARTQSNRATAKELGISEGLVIKVRHLADGKCVRCQRPHDVPDSPTCSVCLESQAAYARKRRAERKQKGVCVQCGNPIAENSDSYCVDHLKHLQKKAVRNRKQRRDRIGDEAYLESQRISNKKYSYGPSSVEVWKEGNGSCALCGKEYTKRGIHIHHIDGNHDNQSKDNMILLCVRCHKLVHELLYHSQPALVLAWVKSTYGINL